MDYFQLRAGLMPASFKVIQEDGEEQLEADFGIVVNFTAIALAKLNVVGIHCYYKKTGRTGLQNVRAN